jgi:hypothetical protein
MKTLNQIGKIMTGNKFIPVMAMLMIAFASCKKDNTEMVLEGEASVMIINAASGSEAQDFYLEGTKVNSEAIVYQESTGYITTPVGYSRKAEFKNSGSEEANFTGYLDILPGGHYTFFYTSNMDGTDESSAVFTDQASASSTKAKVRFVNLASGLATANLLISSGSNIATGVVFGTASAFNEVDPGTISLQTAMVGGGAFTADLGEFTLQAGKIYTIYTSGHITGTVSAGMVIHN